MDYFDTLWREFTALSEVHGIALGGSRTSSHFDETSDYDLYIYCEPIPKENVRRNILKKYCSYMELSNDFWELEDDCTLHDGVDIDILYRNIKEVNQDLSNVVLQCNPRNGYTTCLWHNIIHSTILYDSKGELLELKRKFDIPYPTSLKKNIVFHNLRLLTGNLPSYDKQLLKASNRKDLISVHHRTTAFLESYFDIIFALNKMPHPGEKRMLSYAKENASILPDCFEENIQQFLQVGNNHNKLTNSISNILFELKRIIENDEDF